MTRDKKGITVRGQLPVNEFTSGIYELTVTVRDQQSKHSSQKTAVFGIE